MKSDYEVRAKKFLEKVFPFIEEDIFDPFYVCDAIINFNKTYNRNVQVRFGESRIALITSDYVIKFDYDDEMIEEIGGCENEIQLYAQAVADGMDYLFAKINRYNYNGYSFYIMPRISHIGTHKSRYHQATDFMTTTEITWCNAHNLTDLHSNNYGFRNKKICIVDYAYIDSYEFDEEY